ncbi:cytochrome P450 [Collybia nuda]|uniref:Cytochrome P450 n=1 Tax=Collybia nuda TaxID=64659 RepID=A0A9P6CDP8_9AGAR|nr:cytochrome P450 [Collybia nuda]
MITTADLIAVSLAAVVVLFTFVYRQFTTQNLPLPPGPKPRFFTGNIHQVPFTTPWLTYASWSKIYGPLVYLRIFKTRVLVLNTAKSALDLLEARSAIYSDRPTSWSTSALGGKRQIIFGMSSQNRRFRIYRKALHIGLNIRAVQDYSPIQVQETHTFLKSLLKSPENVFAHIRRFRFIGMSTRNAVAQIMKISYGYQVENDDDPFVRMIEDGIALFRTAFRGFWMWIDIFPLLKFVPDWLPGAGFKRKAREFSKKADEIDQAPYSWAKNNIATGNYTESFTSKHLEDDMLLPTEEKDDIIKYCSAALYIGGADTTVSAITSFFWLMSVYPEVQKKAQQEVEQMIGGRLPTPADHGSMPYISALVKEVVRWAPAAPLGLNVFIPGLRHCVTEDDIYEGYYIPKGTTIIANIWAITHDPEIYPNPSIFDPTRHLGERPQVDPLKFVFGFGRRVCPGAHFAESSMFLTIASVLATFDINKALSPDGREIEPPMEWTSGVTNRLKPFSCRITPRFKDINGILGM